MTQDKLERDIKHGQRARELLDNEVFVEAFDMLRAELIDAWVNSNHTDDLTREKLHVAVTILTNVRANIEQIINSGNDAVINLEWAKQNPSEAIDAINRGHQ